jgi:hypothetical protein
LSKLQIGTGIFLVAIGALILFYGLAWTSVHCTCAVGKPCDCEYAENVITVAIAAPFVGGGVALFLLGKRQAKQQRT